MDVSVIIVTYNSAETVANCIASVQAQQGVEFEIIVVDNASIDGTAAVVGKLGDCINLLANRDNVGFGRANNQGFAASRGRFVYFLNPDAQLIQTDGLARLCQALDQHPGWGLAGTRILSVDGRNETGVATSYPGQQRVRMDFSRLPGTIAWILGASMFFPRRVYAGLNGFDTDFFLYCEETELCLRLRKCGHAIGLVEEVAVRHIGGASERGHDSYQTCLRRMDGLHLFWQKHYPARDVRRLTRLDKWRARFRMLNYGILACFEPTGSPAYLKRRQYQAIWESSKKFLREFTPHA
ncbi:MAG: glycosyltransferase family 2 protein [Limisphaerales bacterium]